MPLLNRFFELNENLDDLNIVHKYVEGIEDFPFAPIGAFIFADCGVDSISYCIVPRKGDGTLDNSPIYTLTPSEGTVMWTAKNLNDCLVLTILGKSSMDLFSLYTMSEEDFNDFLAERNQEIEEWDELEKKKVKTAVKAINSILPQNAVKYDYDYFMSCYQDKENHIDLCFKNDIKMCCYKLGGYCCEEDLHYYINE